MRAWWLVSIVAPSALAACTLMNSDLDDYTGGTKDAGATDTHVDAPIDARAEDGASETTADSSIDTNDVGHDTLADADDTRSDSGVDSETIDSGVDSFVADSGVDSEIDTGFDSGVDTGVDSGVDMGIDSGSTTPGVGEVVISEVLIDAPTVGGVSEVGELVEVYNASPTKTLNLSGCVLRSKKGASGTESTAAFGDLPIAPLHYAALVKQAAAGTSFDFTVAATYGLITFSNSTADYVALQCGSTDVDGVAWNGATDFPDITSAPPVDTTNERSTASLSLGVDGASTTWCNGVTTHTITSTTGSATFKGSPSVANSCP